MTIAELAGAVLADLDRSYLAMFDTVALPSFGGNAGLADAFGGTVASVYRAGYAAALTRVLEYLESHA